MRPTISASYCSRSRGGGAACCASVTVASISRCSLDRVPGPLRVADPLTVVADADPDAGRLVVGRLEEHHVGDVDRALLLDDAPELRALLGVLHRPRALMSLDHREALDEDAMLAGLAAQDL